MRTSSRILRDPVTGGATHSDGRKQGGQQGFPPLPLNMKNGGNVECPKMV